MHEALKSKGLRLNRRDLVRGGKYGEHESKFIEDNRVYLTWNELPDDMTSVADYEGIKQLVQQRFPAEPTRRLGNWSGQIWAFVLAIKTGDWIVMPRKNTATIAIGEIKSPYKFDASGAALYKHYRDIKWLDTEIPRSSFDCECRNKGSQCGGVKGSQSRC